MGEVWQYPSIYVWWYCLIEGSCESVSFMVSKYIPTRNGRPDISQKRLRPKTKEANPINSCQTFIKETIWCDQIILKTAWRQIIRHKLKTNICRYHDVLLSYHPNFLWDWPIQIPKYWSLVQKDLCHSRNKENNSLMVSNCTEIRQINTKSTSWEGFIMIVNWNKRFNSINIIFICI